VVAYLVKMAVSGIKRTFTLSGNVVQTIAAVIALLGAIAQAAMAHLYRQGLTPEAAVGTLLLALLAWLGSMGAHSVLTNRNDATNLPSAEELQERLKRLKAGGTDA
jgi:hypothetical protein